MLLRPIDGFAVVNRFECLYTHFKALIVCTILLLNSQHVYGDDVRFRDLLHQPESIRSLLKDRRLYPVDVPNPHWDAKLCVACHKTGMNTGRSSLRTMDIAALCGYCHNEYFKPAFMHPTGKVISDDMWNRIPDSFRQSLISLGNRASKIVNCLSCHDLKIQCLESRSYERFSNPLFMRNGPKKHRVELCFYCHQKNMFDRFNPHLQIVQGELNKDSCKVCHRNSNNLTRETRLKDVELVVNSNLSGLCVNCHQTKPHPGGELRFTKKKAADHLVVPKKKTRLYMEKMSQKLKIEFPLSDNGEIHCATCHNPHEKGVVAQEAADTGADIKLRLRLEKPCEFCHDT